MSDEATGKAGKTWLYVAGVLAALPILYALSCGPAYVCVERGLLPRAAFHASFEPLFWLLRKTDTVGPAEGYIVGWLKLTGTPIP